MGDEIISNPADDSPGGAPDVDLLGFAALTSAFEQCVEAGWTWHPTAKTLRCPRDSQLSFAIDLQTHRLTVSPKLAQRLAAGFGPFTQEGKP